MRNLLEVFEYNQHFVAMMNVINAARLNPPECGHKHHIIPRCWFKSHNLDTDNSNDNLVLLSAEDHQKVHRLCMLCVKDEDMKSKMGFAVHRLHGSMSGLHHTEDTRKKLSAVRKGKIPKNLTTLHQTNKGKKRTLECRNKMSQSAKVSYENGGHRGGSKFKGMTWKVVNNKRVWYKAEE